MFINRNAEGNSNRATGRAYPEREVKRERAGRLFEGIPARAHTETYIAGGSEMSAVKVKPKGRIMLKETTGFQAGAHGERGTGKRQAKRAEGDAKFPALAKQSELLDAANELRGRVTEEKYLREAAKMLGITVAEARERIKQGREAQAEQERASRAKGREQSIRFNVENLRDCLTDICDLANNAKRGEVGALDPTTILHAIESMTVSAREWLDDLESDCTGGGRG